MLVESQALSYVIFKQAEFVVIALRGPLTRANFAIFQKFQSELDQRDGHYFILNLAHVTEVDHKLVPHFIRLQKSIRDRNGSLQLCVPDLTLRKFLADAGAVRKSEIAATMSDALTTLQAVAKSDEARPILDRRTQLLQSGNPLDRALAGVPDEEEELDEETEEQAVGGKG